MPFLSNHAWLRIAKKKGRPAWPNASSGSQPVDSTAARVVGHGRKKPKHLALKEQAKKERDPDKRRELLRQASEAEANYDRRMTSASAEARARKALERARWLRGEG